MSNFTKNGMNGKPSTINVSTVWLILAIVILFAIVFILGYSFFTGTTVLKEKELTIWSMLIAAAISCVFGAITSHLSQKSEEYRERNIVQKITGTFIEKANEITGAVMLKQADFVSGDQDDILARLMNRCLETRGRIDRIRILAQDSGTFSKFFTTYFAGTPFVCHDLEILIHSPDKNMIKQINDEWMRLFYAKNNDIENLRIRRLNELRQRAFFGMIIKFEQGHHPIGMIGFYKLQDENGGNRLNPFNKRYGVLSEENSILDVLDTYFNRYFNNNSVIVLKEEQKKRPD